MACEMQWKDSGGKWTKRIESGRLRGEKGSAYNSSECLIGLVDVSLLLLPLSSLRFSRILLL